MSVDPKKIEFSYIDHEKESFIEESLEKYLVAIGKINFFQSLSYILKEMVGNANKANLKRIHFLLNNLDINFEPHYKEGMKTFKEKFSAQPADYYQEAEKKGCFVKVILGTIDNKFVISVVNNNPLLNSEKERIVGKMRKASKFKSMEDAINDGLDPEEGAGFGLIITALMLRKLGLDENVFKIGANEKYTEAKVSIPLSLLDKEEGDIIADAIIQEIKEIPQFPEHVIELEKKLANPDSKFSDLSSVINRDPSLIADLLKVANSSMYMLHNRVKSIEEAVRQIGFSGVRSLVLTYSAQKILMASYKLEKIKDIMEHSTEVAYYSYEIAKKYNFKDIKDEVYIAGILHDFGKIIINSLKPNISQKINKICNDKGISSTILENLTDGYNHSIIGAKLCEKWNFSENIIQVIRYHHIPLESDLKHQEMVFTVYLANIVFYYRKKEFEYDKINYQVLKFFNLTKHEDFEKLVDSISLKLN
jgi:putative nucleotidyltransferase with HDIG domain